MTFLVSRTDKIGDLVLSLPVAKFLKTVEPNGKVIFLVRQDLQLIPRLSGAVDEVLGVDVFGERGEIKPESFVKVLFELRRAKPDIAFCLFPRLSVALLFRVAGVRSVGTSRRAYSFLFSHKVNLSRKESKHHEAYYNLLLLKDFFKVPPEGSIFEGLKPLLNFPEGEAKRIARKFGLPERFVVVHPFSGGSTRELPLSFWIELLEKLSEKIQVVLVGKTKDERSLSQKFNFTKNTISLLNRTTLFELCGVLKLSSAVISHASGPLHLACALGKRVVGFYPKDEVVRWRPLGRSILFLREDVLSGKKSVKEIVLDVLDFIFV